MTACVRKFVNFRLFLRNKLKVLTHDVEKPSREVLGRKEIMNGKVMPGERHWKRKLEEREKEAAALQQTTEENSGRKTRAKRTLSTR